VTRLVAAPICTEGLRLDPLQEDDAAEMAGVLADPALHTYIGGEPDDVDRLRARYRRMLAGPRDPAESWLNWIVRDGTGSAIGTVQATVVERAGLMRATVAWVIGVPWQGRGHASAAAAAMVAWLRQQGVTRVTAHVHPEHRAWERVAERCGLAPTGRTVGGERVWERTA
jgi:RimJ/RimL family protein N-acetyltransferase